MFKSRLKPAYSNTRHQKIRSQITELQSNTTEHDKTAKQLEEGFIELNKK